MKKVLFILFVTCLLSYSGSIAQGLKIGAGAGITMIQGPDVFTDDLDKGGAGLGSEIHYGAKAKLSLPLFPLTFTGSFTYVDLASDQDGVEYSSNISSIGLGAEMSLVPGPFSPYVGAEFLVNTFGDAEIKAEGGSIKIKGDSRNGLGVGVGADIKIFPKVDVDISAKYVVFNLMGKEKGEDTISAINLNVTLLLNIL